MTIMKQKLTFAVLACLGAALSIPARAAEPDSPSVTLDFGADVVSSYIWRGQELGGFSVQPYATLSLTKANLSFGVWASAELFEHANACNMTEFDLVLAWNPVEALTIGLTDYYLAGNSYFSSWRWNSSASHNLEAQVAYDFGCLSVSLNTCLTGFDHDADGDRCYSTYAEVSAPFKLGGVECAATVGACLMEDHFTNVAVPNDKLSVCNLSLSASKEIFHLPLSGQVIFNPQTDNAYFVVGLSF